MGVVMEPSGPRTDLWARLVRECSPLTVKALEPHAALLLNMSEVAAERMPAGVPGFLKFMRFLDDICVQLVNAQAIAHSAESRCARLLLDVQRLRQNRATDLYMASMQATHRAMDAEQQARATLHQELESVSQQFRASQQRHAAAINTWQQTEQGLRAALDAEVLRRAQTQRSSDDQELLRYQLQRSTGAETCANQALQRERSELSALRLEMAKLDIEAVQPWRSLVAAGLGCILELARFLCFEAPALSASVAAAPQSGKGSQQPAMLPVLAIEWASRGSWGAHKGGNAATVSSSSSEEPADKGPPAAAPGPELCALNWGSVAPNGAFGLLARLCSGELRPTDDELSLTVTHVEGRWLGPLDGALESARLAALVAFQALRLDLPVYATCRIVPTPVALREAVKALEPARRCVPAVGLVDGDGRIPAVRHQPSTSEAVLIAVLQGAPFEREARAALRAIHVAC